MIQAKNVVQRRVLIHNAEQVLSQKIAETAFQTAKQELIKMVKEDFRDFDLSMETLLKVSSLSNRWLQSASKKESISLEKIIIEVKDKAGLNRIKQGLAVAILKQLGALYTPKYYNNQSANCYDSPTSGKRIELGTYVNGSQCELDYIFDADAVLKDIPLLIQKSQKLAKELEEVGL